jgi:hypothetical protein
MKLLSRDGADEYCEAVAVTDTKFKLPAGTAIAERAAEALNAL